MWPDVRVVIGALGALAAVTVPVLVVDQMARSEAPRDAAGDTDKASTGTAGVPPLIDGAPVAPKTDAEALRRLGVPSAERGVPDAPDGAMLAARVQVGDPLQAVWESSLAGREEALRRAREALAEQAAELERREARLAARWREANARHEAAARRWSANARLLTPDGELTFPMSRDEANAWLDQVVAIVKKMKPKEAAAMVSEWDDALTVDLLARLSGRLSAPVLGAMEPKTAARVTAMLARGGPPTPLPDAAAEEEAR